MFVSATSLAFPQAAYQAQARAGSAPEAAPKQVLPAVAASLTEAVDGQQVDTEEIGRETQIGMIPTIQKVYGEQASVSSFVGPEVEDGVPVEGVAAVYTSQRATAYSASGTAKGASGRRLTYGTVAINPSIIPYGSLMYITSDDGKFVYGYAYAADTGTAMMTGHAFIDLYYETYDESVDNAVIPVTVYVLDDETAAKYKEQNDAILEADTTVGR